MSDDTTEFSDEILPLVVAFAREVSGSPAWMPWPEPKPGDLVVETTGMGRPLDPQAIGWLVAHGDAPYGEDDPTDGSVPMREVWDVLPLDPNVVLPRGYQRWENATFRVVPDWFVKRAGLTCPDLGAA